MHCNITQAMIAHIAIKFEHMVLMEIMVFLVLQLLFILLYPIRHVLHQQQYQYLRQQLDPVDTQHYHGLVQEQALKILFLDIMFMQMMVEVIIMLIALEMWAHVQYKQRANNGEARTFIVYTLGTVSGYNSGPSSAYATLTASWTNPTAPTLVTLSSTHVASGNSTLSWSGAEAGTNNAIAKYHVYRSVNDAAYAFLTEVTSTSTSVASAAAGSYHTYAVYTGGVVADTWSAISTATATLYTYTNPGVAPNFLY